MVTSYMVCSVGYNVSTSGRLHLPKSDDAAAVAAVKAACVGRRGWFDPDESSPSDTLADIAWVGVASVTRDEDWIEFAHDDEGDPKWSHQATAFYLAIAPFVRSGIVQFIGETDERWSYTYADGQITQRGLNGYDHSIVIGGSLGTLAYNVESSGRLNLPKSDDAAAVAAVKAACAERSGWFHPDESSPSDTLADIAWVGAASITRDGDWIQFEHPEGLNPKWPKWSDQVTAFYVAIAPFVRSGIVQFIGEDESPDRIDRWPDARWSYTYADGQITQQGWNGWDKSIEPFGESVEPPQDLA
jgi:hypothetical protein